MLKNHPYYRTWPFLFESYFIIHFMYIMLSLWVQLLLDLSSLLSPKVSSTSHHEYLWHFSSWAKTLIDIFGLLTWHWYIVDYLHEALAVSVESKMSFFTLKVLEELFCFTRQCWQIVILCVYYVTPKLCLFILVWLKFLNILQKKIFCDALPLQKSTPFGLSRWTFSL